MRCDLFPSRARRAFPACALLTCLAVLGLAFPAHAVDESFSKNCAPCHGVDGHARTPAGRKAGAKDFALSKLSEAEIIEVIRKGRADKAGKPTMPAFGEKLSDPEVTKLARIVIGFRK